MSEPQRVGLQLADVNQRARGDRAREALAAALEGAEVTEPDADGTFEAVVASGSREQALTQVFDAIAAAGVDDDVVMLEHPDVRHHWEHGSERPGAAP